ncbi:MAG: hypothetical protein EBT00_16730, partial [Proteobacteria bacterium]|nr:hypothetical protein [Pseudomonadota bacterium]
TLPTVTLANGGSGLAYTGTFIIPAGDGTVTATVSATDTAGNALSATGQTGFTIDNTAPTVTSIVRASNAAALTTGASAPAFTVTFSESVSGVTAANFAVNRGSGIDGTPPTIASVTGSGTTWTVTLGVTDTTGDYGSNTNATLGLTVVPASNAVDAAGNALASATVTGTNESYNLDTTAPVVSGVTSTLANGSYKAGQAVPVTVTFSEPVTVTGTPQLTLATGTPSTTAVNYTSGSGTTVLTFTYMVAAGNTSADLDYAATTSLALNGGTIRDAAGNDATRTLASPGASGSLGNAKALVIDTTAPTVTSITRVNSQLTKDPPAFTVTFSEPVFGVAFQNFAVRKGPGVTGTEAIGVSGSGATRTVTITGLGGDYGKNGTETVDLTYKPVGATVTDLAGNVWTGSDTDAGRPYYLDTQRPTVISVTTADSGPKAPGATVAFDVKFGEAVFVTGTPTVTMATGLGAATYTSGSGTATLTFTYTVRAADANALRLDYASQSALAGTITDSAGGAYVTANGLPQQVGYSGLYTANVYVDKVAPTVSKVTAPSRTNPPYYRTFQVPISVEFSEAVVVSGTPTLTLALCASETTPCADQVTQNAAYSSGSGTKVLVFSYKVITGVTTNGAPLQYSSTGALAGTIKDVAGNDAILTLPSLTSSASLGSTTAGNVS